MNPAEFSRLETLRDGRAVLIRAQRPADGEGFRMALARVSDETIYRRFMGPRREFSGSEQNHFLSIDFVSQVALVAEVEENGAQAIVAGGRYILFSPGVAEVAFAVIDDYQGQGLGGKLLACLIDIAGRAGLNEFVAEVLTGNSAMLKVFRRSGLAMTTRLEGPTTHVSMKLVLGSA